MTELASSERYRRCAHPPRSGLPARFVVVRVGFDRLTTHEIQPRKEDRRRRQAVKQRVRLQQRFVSVAGWAQQIALARISMLP